MSFRRITLTTLTALLLAGPSMVAQADETNEIAAKAFHVLNKHCARCHFSDNGSFNVLDSKDLVESGRVEAKSPEDSYLFEMVTENRMPPKAVLHRPTAEEGEVLRQWILQGAPAFPTPTKRPFVKLESVLQNVLDYQRSLQNRDDAIWLRFFTLHNVYNNSKVFDVDLNTYRAALSKAVNSLSWGNRIVVPQAINDEKTLFVIDIRDYGWEKGDKWSDILAAYPYGLNYDGLPDKNLSNIHAEIVHNADDCGLPMIRADWFIATATRPQLYHTLLEIPENAKELEYRLNVNVQQNFMNPKTERIARSGFAQSRVSEQNRLLERHDAAFGYYWKSYDIKPGTGEDGDFIRRPLGPAFENFPGRQLGVFTHDGGEIIYGLPNGLQAYMLVTGEDERIDQGPPDVVFDPNSHGGSFLITNGISCMGCHRNGMFQWEKDDVRPLYESKAGQKMADQVLNLFPTNETMQRLVRQDRDHYLQALELATGSFLKVGDDAETEITVQLPGFRWEIISNDKARLLTLTCLTPEGPKRTRITQLTWWTGAPLLRLAIPIAKPMARKFLRQDGDMVDLQNLGMEHQKAMMWIDDIDVQAKWYQMLKKEWAASRKAGREFKNKIKPTILRWRS